MAIQRFLDRLTFGRLRLAALAMTMLLFFAAPASAQTFPKLTGRVVDQAQLLTPAQVVDLTSKSQTLETQTGRQFVIATVKSLEGYPIEDYAYRLGREWKIGDQKRDDGVLLLVAPNERRVWIATGYGAGGFLTDAMSGLIDDRGPIVFRKGLRRSRRRQREQRQPQDSEKAAHLSRRC